MPIQVLCPGCKKRFQVSEKFAGKQGPCPQCKTIIKIPEKTEEVVIHAPDEVRPGTKATVGGGGAPVFKPIRRTYWNLSAGMLVGVVAGIAVTFLVALFVGQAFKGQAIPWPILALGALLVAPPLVLGGYQFLRDPELDGYRGQSLWIRVAICSLVFAALWGAYAILKWFWIGAAPPELWQLTFIVPAMVACGAIAPFAALDFEYGTAAFHYGLYLAVTVLLRLTMFQNPFG
jgi:hypothetical protein